MFYASSSKVLKSVLLVPLIASYFPKIFRRIAKDLPPPLAVLQNHVLTPFHITHKPFYCRTLSLPTHSHSRDLNFLRYLSFFAFFAFMQKRGFLALLFASFFMSLSGRN